MCIFHLRENHDGDSCPEMNRHGQLTTSNELTIEYLESEDDYAPHGDSETFFLEYDWIQMLEVTYFIPWMEYR